MRFLICGAALSAAFIGGIAFATASGATGLDGLHDQVRIGDRICMVGHEHRGESGSWNTKQEAQASAASSWGGFTGLEYGREWAEYRLATNQSMTCNTVDNDRGGVFWSCKVKATPCRPDSPVEYAGAPHAIHVAPAAPPAPVHVARPPLVVAERSAPVLVQQPVMDPVVAYRPARAWRHRHPGIVWQGHAFRPDLRRFGHVEGHVHGPHCAAVHGITHHGHAAHSHVHGVIAGDRRGLVWPGDAR